MRLKAKPAGEVCVGIRALPKTSPPARVGGDRMKLVVDDGGSALAGHGNEVNDCVCRAAAIATERPYQEIYDRLEAMIQAKFGPVKRPRGVETTMLHELMTALGWVWMPSLKKRLRKDHLPSGRIVVCFANHVVAVVDGGHLG